MQGKQTIHYITLNLAYKPSIPGPCLITVTPHFFYLVTLFLILLYLGFMGLSLFPNTIILFLFIISYPLSLLYGLSLFLYILSYPEAYVPFHYTFPIYISWYTLGSLPPSSLPGYCHPYPLFPLHILYNILLSIITGTQLIPNKKIINKRKIECSRSHNKR